MIEELLGQIRSEEGWKPHVYPDSLGYATIGYGFLVDSRNGAGIPRPVAEFWLNYIVNDLLDELPKRWPPFSDQPIDVQQALVNMAYQMGVDGVLGFKRMLAALEAGDRATAADEALDSEWAGPEQTPDRARRVAAKIRGVT